ncbi:MAG: NADH-quinone oxidoreductase subunit M [Vicingaceae bacterium]
MLNILIIIPLLTVLGILFTVKWEQVRWVALVGMSLQLLFSLFLLWQFLAMEGVSESGMRLEESHLWYKHLNITYSIGIDGISMALILLTSVVIFSGILASWNVETMTKEFFLLLILLSTGVFGFFISLDLFTMFLFYELAVIPMYLLIGIWGSGPKEYAAMKLTLMLMAGSALLLVGILGLYFHSSTDGQLSFHILDIARQNIDSGTQRWIFPMTFIGFGVLGALFPFHTWSPDGHASAPTAVSMLHAGVLMKLGGYGCFRVAMFLLPQAADELSWIFIILTTIGVIYGAFGAVVQKDLKYINAYSSVSHCGLVLFAILMMNKTAFNGAILQMLSHGLMCALFFGLIGMIYARTGTRDITKMGGLMKVMPFLSVSYVICGLASLGLPGLSGFVAEMTIFVGAFDHPDAFHRISTVIAISSIVVTAVYVLQAVAKMLLGPIGEEKFEKITDAKWHEKLSSMTLIIAILIMGIIPLWLSDMIYDSLDLMMNKFSTLSYLVE